MTEALRALPDVGWSVITIAAGTLSFFLSLLLIRSSAASWDERLFMRLNRRTGSTSSAARIVARATTPLALVLSAILAAFLVIRARGWEAVILCGVAAGLGWALANGAKLLIDRPRPYRSMTEAVLRQDPARGTSFPSSHVAIVTAVVVGLLPLVPRPWRAVGVGVIVLLAWSRLYYGVHHPLDLLAGAGAGVVAAGLAWLALGAIARA
jgi:membrane-associated phospholipid phosphatase